MSAVVRAENKVRRRIVTVALSAVVLAVTVFGLPLAILVQRMIIADEQGELERLALRAAVDVGPTYPSGDPIELPPTESEVDLAVYDARGRPVTGRGPDRLESALAAALSGAIVERHNDDLEVAVPVSSDEQVIAVVRASSPSRLVEHRVWWSWAGMTGIGLIAAGAAWLLARRQSTILVQPMTDLERVSTDLGAGNFGARATPSGVPEIDRAGHALNQTADRLEALIIRQRSFVVDASHQLRTPLTRLRLELEDGLTRDAEGLEQSVGEALVSAEVLSRTVDDVLELARGGRSTDSFDVETLLTGVRENWHGILAAADRPLRITSEPDLRVAASLAAARQIVHTLVDNAFQHGRGVVEVRARDVGDVVAIDVMDEGGPFEPTIPAAEVPGAPGGDRSSMGLRLARSLAEAEGGRLAAGREDTRTRFTVFLQAPPS
jgi:signal transduction histidine kinase